MVILPRRLALLALPLLAGAALACALALPGSASAATACHQYGHKSPGRVNPHHAEEAVLCYINRRRGSHGLHRLSGSRKLFDAAGRHSEYMLDHHCFDHVCGGEASVTTRLRSSGYLLGGLRAWAYGENIAWGEHHRGTPAQIVHTWMHSAEHRANILNPTFRDAGVGIDWGTPKSPKANGGTYTMDYGYRDK